MVGTRAAYEGQREIQLRIIISHKREYIPKAKYFNFPLFVESLLVKLSPETYINANEK